MDVDEWGPELVIQTYHQPTGVQGILVIDNTALGPGKGGIRLVPNVTVDEVRRLARTMTWKNALAELPWGGAKAGIVYNPKLEKAIHLRAFARRIRHLVPSLYIAGPDMNCGESEMAVFAEEIGTPKAATGKPAAMGGLPHELGSTGFGVAKATLVALEHERIKPQDASIAIEGFGNVGTFTAKFLAEAGCRIVAVSDSKGAIYDERGLDVTKLLEVKHAQGTVTKYPEGKVLPTRDLFALPVTVLIPGARPDVITEANYQSVRAPIIVEAANIPISPDIEARLAREKGTLIIPDFVANAGGVISSYCEWMGWDQKKMFQVVEEKIVKNTRLVLQRMRGRDARAAAERIASERVRAAMKKQK
ncbi:MAG: Glu/Leu/Phe/Val dehydrogenase [Candidatus Micrarchaeia archaeon]